MPSLHHLCLLAIIVLIAGTPWSLGAPSPTQPVRGTWISTYSCSSSQKAMTACVQSLHSTGVNTLYIDVWHNGQAYFKCPAIVGLLGTQGQAQDLVHLHANAPVHSLATMLTHCSCFHLAQLGWAVAAAAPLAMKVVAWLEYGLIAAPVNYTTPFSTLAHSRGWVLPGSFAGFTWMNAGNQHVLNFLSSLVTDLQHGYRAERHAMPPLMNSPTPQTPQPATPPCMLSSLMTTLPYQRRYQAPV